MKIWIVEVVSTTKHEHWSSVEAVYSFPITAEQATKAEGMSVGDFEEVEVT